MESGSTRPMPEVGRPASVTQLSSLLQSFDLDCVLADSRLERVQAPLDHFTKIGEALLHLGLCRACVLGDGRNAGDHVLVQDVHVAVQVNHTAVQAIHTAFQVAHTAFQPIHSAIEAIHPAIEAIHPAIEAIHTAVQAANVGLEVGS